MRDDEFQVLGSGKTKRNVWKRVALVTVSIVSIVGLVLAVQKHNADLAAKAWAESLGNTIDTGLQDTVDSLLNQKLTDLAGLHGQVIVMEVQTGAIKAMVGLERSYKGGYQPCDNVVYQQEPGSTMKTAVVLSLLETGEVKLTDEVDVGDGIWDVDEDSQMKDHNWNRGGYGVIDMVRVLEVSSNIGISKMVNKVFKGKELDYFNSLDRMSFGQPDSIEGIVGLRPMLYDSPKDSTWASKQMLWSSIGYERYMSAIQTLTFYNAIANDGKMVKPSLRLGETEVINEQIASKENIAEIQKALYLVVSEGLAKPAGTPLVAVAGKTGTAEVSSHYEGHEYHVSFCGYFPAFSPKYSIIVSLNKPGLPASGGVMAGSVFHDIVEWMVEHGMLD